MSSSGKLCRVALVRIEVEEGITFIFSRTRFGDLGTKLTGTGNRKTLNINVPNASVC
jgi:hypothetical protein